MSYILTVLGSTNKIEWFVFENNFPNLIVYQNIIKYAFYTCISVKLTYEICNSLILFIFSSSINQSKCNLEFNSDTLMNVNTFNVYFEQFHIQWITEIIILTFCFKNQ